MEQYISKSVLVAEIKKLEKMYCYDNKTNSGLVAISVFENINNVINTLEVKEVDLEKEYEKYYEQERYIQTFKLAKHFFELGLKVAQKGE